MMMVSPRVIGRGYRSWRIYVVIALRTLSSFLRPLPINVSGDLNFGVGNLDLQFLASNYLFVLGRSQEPEVEIFWKSKYPRSEDWYQSSDSWYVRAASRRLLATPTVERTQNEIYLYWRKYDV